jgi:hypothetical protein
MMRCTIKLTKSEVEELESIVKRGSPNPKSIYQAACILLNMNEENYSRKAINEGS